MKSGYELKKAHKAHMGLYSMPLIKLHLQDVNGPVEAQILGCKRPGLIDESGMKLQTSEVFH